MRIVDSKDKRPLPYAAVRSIDHKAGTYSDSNGLVILSNHFPDSIIISCIGYRSITVKKENVRNDTIYLDREVSNLPFVTVSPLKFSKEVTSGNLRGKKSETWIGNGDGLEFVGKITFPDSTKKYKIKIVRIAIERIAPEIPVILRIYDVATNGYPMNNLLHSTILLKKENFNKRKKIVELDVSNANIIITDPSCFIGIEWLPISAHEPPLAWSTTALILTEDFPNQFTYYRTFKFKKDWMFALNFPSQTNPNNMLVSVTADEYR